MSAMKVVLPLSRRYKRQVASISNLVSGSPLESARIPWPDAITNHHPLLAAELSWSYISKGGPLVQSSPSTQTKALAW